MPDLQLDKLAQYPVLQFIAAVLGLAAFALAIYKGLRDRPATPAPQAPQVPQEQRWFFDGPLSVAIAILRDIKNHMSRLVENTASLPEELRKQTDEMREQTELMQKQIEMLRETKGLIENLPSVRRRRTG